MGSGGTGSSMKVFGAEILLCPVEARAEALEVLYRRMPRAFRKHLVAEVLADERRGEVDLAGLWVARIRSGRIVGAMMTQAMPGRSAALWPPEIGPSWRRNAIASAMVRQAIDDLASRGFRLVQAALDESAGDQAGRDLARGGLPRVTDLLYLSRETAPLLPKPDRPLLCDFEWRPFEASIEDRFRAAMQASYEGSLDMPELEGARGLDEIIEGHQAAGLFVADRWRLGWLPDEPTAQAVLLMTAVPARDAWEVVYLGLSPAARGRGLGRAAMDYALRFAREHTPVLELAVDLRNTPAVRLYQSTGFVPCHQRTIHLTLLGTNPSKLP